jgi:hypothetical protein
LPTLVVLSDNRVALATVAIERTTMTLTRSRRLLAALAAATAAAVLPS